MARSKRNPEFLGRTPHRHYVITEEGTPYQLKIDETDDYVMVGGVKLNSQKAAELRNGLTHWMQERRHRQAIKERKNEQARQDNRTASSGTD